ncbi:MAG: translation initiation factor IF-2, partial [Synechococcus sp.]
DGKIPRNAGARLIRDGVEIWTGKLASLRRFKDDVKEVATGFECGVGTDRFANWEEGDRIEAFKMVTQRRKLTT